MKNYALRRVSYNTLREAFNKWADNEGIPLEKREAAYSSFQSSHKTLKGLPVPEDLNVYAKFRNGGGFFQPPKKLPAVLKKIQSGKLKNANEADALEKNVKSVIEKFLSFCAEGIKDELGGKILSLVKDKLLTAETENNELRNRLKKIEGDVREFADKFFGAAETLKKSVSSFGDKPPLKKLSLKKSLLKSPPRKNQPRRKRAYRRKHPAGGEKPPPSEDATNTEKTDPEKENPGSDSKPPKKKEVIKENPGSKIFIRHYGGVHSPSINERSDVFEVQEHNGLYLCTDCLSLVGMDSLEDQLRAVRMDRKRAEMYIEFNKRLIYGLGIYKRLIKDHDVKDEADLKALRERIKEKKPNALPFYPEDTKSAYGKKPKEIINIVLEEAKTAATAPLAN